MNQAKQGGESAPEAALEAHKLMRDLGTAPVGIGRTPPGPGFTGDPRCDRAQRWQYFRRGPQARRQPQHALSQVAGLTADHWLDWYRSGLTEPVVLQVSQWHRENHRMLPPLCDAWIGT